MRVWLHAVMVTFFVTVVVSVTPIVTWSRDPDWYEKRSKVDLERAPESKGCCPAAFSIYSDVGHDRTVRCCTGRKYHIEPLRPTGGLNFSNANARDILSQKTIVLLGDSMAEQQGISLICLAWAQGATVMRMPGRKPYTWSFRVTFKSSSSIEFTVAWIKYPRPAGTAARLDAERVEFELRNVDIAIYAGWHRLIGSMPDHARWIVSFRNSSHLPTIIVEALPTHFPGGLYERNGHYPLVTSAHKYSTPHYGGMCDDARVQNVTYAFDLLNQNIDYSEHNIALKQIVGALGDKCSGLALLSAEYLYTDRGDTHVGLLEIKGEPPVSMLNATENRGRRLRSKIRDCLHFCVLPGVLDALAMSTLHVVVDMLHLRIENEHCKLGETGVDL